MQHKNNFSNIIFLLLLGLVFSQCSTPKTNSFNKFTHIKGHEMEGGEMKEIILERDGTGQLDASVWSELRAELMSSQKNYLANPDQYAVIFYYPGKDKNNASGTATRDDIGAEYFHYLTQKNRICDCPQFNFYKDDQGLERYSKNAKWLKDPNSMIEKYIFKWNVQGSMYAIIDSKGAYQYQLGEFAYEQVLEELIELAHGE